MTHQSSVGLEGSTGGQALLKQGIPHPAMLFFATFSIATLSNATRIPARKAQ
jgi:hypothetical protein